MVWRILFSRVKAAMERQRLQKVLAARGVASRRRAEEMIRQGRVCVNGQVITQMGFRVDPRTDRISVDGIPIQGSSRLVYLALNKPVGVISSARDPRGRKTVVDLITGVSERIYPVGRLDADSEGLVLLTNDGELALRLMHPRYGVSKLYRVWVKSKPSKQVLQALENGVMLTDGLTAPARVRLGTNDENGTQLEIELSEGRNRQIRRMCEAVGHPVVRLRREKIGPLALGSLREGQWRRLSAAELRSLRRAAGLEPNGG
ncbi:MAG: pseudouridine synthase [Limnochordia bacterium]|jgi:23S rRNA pseudouridine2605 synthase